jgi:FKBP-type peptidyl-prolyl cis-trans isomerase
METDSIFDDGTLFEYPLSGLIKGWQIGIPKLEKRGKGTFFIPSGLAYGNKDAGTIPANSVLIFDIYLANFQ